MILWVRAFLFYLGLAGSVFLFLPLACLSRVLSFPLRFYLLSRWAVFNLWWLKWTCGLTCHIEGQQHILKDAAVVMCKHQSAWETLLLQTLFVPQTWVLKKELLWIPFYGWALAALEPVAIKRSTASVALRSILTEGKERLERGIWMVIFPEGTRTRPGEYKPYQPGAAMLAAHAGVSVIPVAHNAGHFWPKNSWVKYPGCITVIIGAPISTEACSAKEITNKVESWIENQMQHLSQKESG